MHDDGGGAFPAPGPSQQGQFWFVVAEDHQVIWNDVDGQGLRVCKLALFVQWWSRNATMTLPQRAHVAPACDEHPF
jgi:hypothetical protein